MATPNMNLSLPIVSITEGTEWATALNTAIEMIDAHDHSSGKGSKVTPAGLFINSNLEFNDNSIYELKSARFQEQSAALTGSANSNGLHSVLGNLYWTNGSGVAVQLTSGGSLVSATPSTNSYETLAVSANLGINSIDTYSYLLVDTTVSRTITLPAASAVSNGRFYIIKDVSGQSFANNISIAVTGADTIDGDSSATLSSNYGSWTIVGDGTSEWHIS